MTQKFRPGKNKMRTIKIFGDTYLVRKTYDIIDYYGGVWGWEVCDENGKFLLQYDCLRLYDLIKFLKWKIYRVYEGTYTYNK